MTEQGLPVIRTENPKSSPKKRVYGRKCFAPLVRSESGAVTGQTGCARQGSYPPDPAFRALAAFRRLWQNQRAMATSSRLLVASRTFADSRVHDSSATSPRGSVGRVRVVGSLATAEKNVLAGRPSWSCGGGSGFLGGGVKALRIPVGGKVEFAAAKGRRAGGCCEASLDALIFDCDGVILESEDLHRRAYNLTFEHFNVKCGSKLVDWDTEFYDVLQNTIGGGKPKMRW